MIDPDPAAIPIELFPLADALDLVSAYPCSVGWKASGFPGAPAWSLVPNAPPNDGVHRVSSVSPGVCLRLELTHPVLPAGMRQALIAMYPAHVGKDGAFYQFGISYRSQYANRQSAVLELAVKVASAMK